MEPTNATTEFEQRECSHDEQVGDRLQALRGRHRHDDEQVAREGEHHCAQAEDHKRREPQQVRQRALLSAPLVSCVPGGSSGS